MTMTDSYHHIPTTWHHRISLPLLSSGMIPPLCNSRSSLSTCPRMGACREQDMGQLPIPGPVAAASTQAQDLSFLGTLIEWACYIAVTPGYPGWKHRDVTWDTPRCHSRGESCWVGL